MNSDLNKHSLGQHVSLGQLLESLVVGIPGEQTVLDKNFGDRWEAYRPIFERLFNSGYASLAREIAPSPILISETEIETIFRIAQQQQRDVGLGVSVLNLAYTQRFAFEKFAESSLKVKVQRVPYPPAESDRTRSERTQDDTE